MLFHLGILYVLSSISKTNLYCQSAHFIILSVVGIGGILLGRNKIGILRGWKCSVSWDKQYYQDIFTCKFSSSHIIRYFFYVLFIYFYCCWGYIVTFTKVVTIYHSWIHPTPIKFLYFPSLHSWNGKLNRCHFSIYIHEYIIFWKPHIFSHMGNTNLIQNKRNIMKNSSH
jgi:hypothetical protein